MKISVNNPCPCGSEKKYKKCCQIYHKGANAKDCLTLMKSRYSAYALGDANYIIKTTHKDNPAYTNDLDQCKSDIKNFCKQTEFKKLTIINYEENIVEFIAHFQTGEMREKSLFAKEDGVWKYIDALTLNHK